LLTFLPTHLHVASSSNFYLYIKMLFNLQISVPSFESCTLFMTLMFLHVNTFYVICLLLIFVFLFLQRRKLLNFQREKRKLKVPQNCKRNV
jgi:hypothetical protein